MAKKRSIQETHVHITPAGLEKLASEIWSPTTWRAEFEKETGISYSQLHRYMTVYNGQTIPRIVVLALEGMRMLKTGPEGKVMLDIEPYRAPIADAVPVKFVQQKKERPARAVDPTPVMNFFDDEPAAPVTEKPVEAVAPETAPTVPEVKESAPAAKAAPKRASLKPAATKPAKPAAKAAPAKAKPAATKKPAAKKKEKAA